MNIAYVTKLIWQLHTRPDKLWVKILRAKYGRGSNLMEMLNHNTTGSWVWRSLIQCRTSFLRGACQQIAQHSRLNIHGTRWIPAAPSFQVPATVDLPESIQYVKDLMSSNGTAWNIDTLQRYFSPELVRMILKVHILASPEQEALVWVPSKVGEFSIKSCYRENHRECFSTNSSITREQWKRLWLSDLHGRHKTLIWRLLSGIMPTRARLHHFFEIGDLECPLCHHAEETLQHLVLECPFVQALWRLSKWNIRIEHFSPLSCLDWIMLLLDLDTESPVRSRDKREFLHFAVSTIEQTWMHRNKILRDDSPFDMIAIAGSIQRQANGLTKAATLRKSKIKTPPMDTWSPPPVGFCKVNFDSAFDGDFATAGLLLRNPLGDIVAAWSGIFVASSPFEAEAIAALQAFLWAELRGLTHAQFEGDARNVILALNGMDDFVEWYGRQSILQGRSLLSKHRFWSTSHIGRKGNRAAHNLAAWANSCNSFGNIDPVELPPAVFCDRGGTAGSSCIFTPDEVVSNEDA